MERTILVRCCAVICVILVCLEEVLTSPHDLHRKSLTAESDSLIKDDGPQFFWLGPRSGRKKRNSMGDEPTNLENDREQLLNPEPWIIMALNKGRRHTVSFTPRLGRESGEENYINGIPEDQWPQQNDDVLNEILSRRSPFTPRLGRNFTPYSPRLGRRITKTLIA